MEGYKKHVLFLRLKIVISYCILFEIKKDKISQLFSRFDIFSVLCPFKIYLVNCSMKYNNVSEKYNYLCLIFYIPKYFIFDYMFLFLSIICYQTKLTHAKSGKSTFKRHRNAFFSELHVSSRRLYQDLY